MTYLRCTIGRWTIDLDSEEGREAFRLIDTVRSVEGSQARDPRANHAEPGKCLRVLLLRRTEVSGRRYRQDVGRSL